MAVVRKTLVPLGDFTGEGRDGRRVTVRVTPERVRRWVGDFGRMTALGLKVPVPFGHQNEALPCDPANPDEQAYLASRYNAGYLAALESGADGGLVGVIDAPAMTADADGNLVDPATGTALREVSVGIDDLTDGKGREWKDVIVHAALTPWPVWAGQDGFQALGRRPSPTLIRLSIGGSAVAEDPKPAEKPPDKTPDPKPPEAGAGDADILTPAAPDANQQLVAQLRTELAGMGVTLPDNIDGSDVTKFLEHMLTAITVIKARAGQQKPPAPPADPQPQQPPAKEEQPQAMYMSIESYRRDPAYRTLVNREHKRVSDELQAKIDGLAKLGCPPAVVTRLKAYSRGVRLSLSAKAVALDGPVPAQVDLLTEVLSQLPEQARTWLALSKATEAASPFDRDAAGGVTQQAKTLEEMKQAAFPNRKKPQPEPAA